MKKTKQKETKTKTKKTPTKQTNKQTKKQNKTKQMKIFSIGRNYCKSINGILKRSYK